MEGVIGYTTLFAGNFAPTSWAFCQGQLVNIASNTALFSIVGTMYGGNGKTTFGLPDLRGRAVTGAGQGPGLPDYSEGQTGGVESTTLLMTQMPIHIHPISVGITSGSATAAASNDPTNAVYAPDSGGGAVYSSSANANMQSYPAALAMTNTGNSLPFSNRNPYLALNYIICLQGVFPSRN